MTFSSPQALKVRAPGVVGHTNTAFWFPTPPGLTVLPATPAVTINGSPAPSNSIPVPAGFNYEFPDLKALFAALPTNVPTVFPETMEPNGQTIVPGFNEVQRYEYSIRLRAEVSFIRYAATTSFLLPLALRIISPNVIGVPVILEGGSSSGVGGDVQFGQGNIFSPGNGDGVGQAVSFVPSWLVALGGSGAGVGQAVDLLPGWLVSDPGSGAGVGQAVNLAPGWLDALPGTGTGVGQEVNLGLPAYRYWRITSLSVFNPANFLQIAEMEYATDDAGSIVSRPSDGASAATAYLGPDGGGSVANVNDNNTATDAAWSSSRYGDSLFHITIDMGSNRQITHWRQRWTGVFGTGLSGLTVQASNTAGSGYVTITTLSGLTNPGADTWSSWIQLR
jgi:hypothetical protein